MLRYNYTRDNIIEDPCDW